MTSSSQSMRRNSKNKNSMENLKSFGNFITESKDIVVNGMDSKKVYWCIALPDKSEWGEFNSYGMTIPVTLIVSDQPNKTSDNNEFITKAIDAVKMRITDYGFEDCANCGIYEITPQRDMKPEEIVDDITDKINKSFPNWEMKDLLAQ